MTSGSRFAHTKIPGQPPLLSEAIPAAVLSEIADGHQMLRASGVFGPGAIEEIALEVWQDSGEPVVVREAQLAVQKLKTP